jgi:perosamine synthetase
LSFGRGKNISCGTGGAILTNDDQIGAAISHDYGSLPQESIFGMLKNWLEVAATQLLLHPSCYWIPAGLPFLKLGETKFYKDFPVMRMDPVRAGLLGGWKDRLTHATAIRVAHAAQTLKSVEGSYVQTITPNQKGRSVYLRLPLLMRSKEEKEALCRISADQGLGMSSMYPSSIEDLPELHDMVSSQHVPQSAMIAERLITLPTHEFLSSSDLGRIRRAIEQVQQAEDAPAAYPSLARTQERTVSELPRAN